MQFYALFILLLLSLSLPCLHAYSNNVFSKDRTIIYPETGLFLDYIGLYTPSETVIHNSAIFPMTAASCYLLPLEAATAVPSCNITRTRHKRSITTIVTVGMGAASLAISISNSIQIRNLHKQMALVENTLSKFSQTVKIHGAQLATLSSKYIELAEELQTTQEFIEDMTPIVISNSKNIDSLTTSLKELHAELQHSFLRLAIGRISQNELNLDFLSPDDVQKVVNNVIKQGNLAFNHYHKSLPIVQIITKLLVRQQIDFVPRSQYIAEDRDEIGRLVITSFFSVPQPNQTPFYTYRLLSVPFFHENETIQLAHIPRYWGINPTTNNTIEWQNPQEHGCDLRYMTSCRDTPAIRKISRDTCFHEIVATRPLSKCHTIPVPIDENFVQHLRDNLWITSSSKPLHCVKTPSTSYLNNIHQIESINEEIILPSVSLVNVTDGYTVLCPGFTLSGRSVTSNVSSLVISYNSSVHTKNISVMNVHKLITKNMTWFRKKITEQEKKDLMNFLQELDAVSTHGSFFPTQTQPFDVLIISLIFFGLVFTLSYYVYRCKRDIVKAIFKR